MSAIPELTQNPRMAAPATHPTQTALSEDEPKRLSAYLRAVSTGPWDLQRERADRAQTAQHSQPGSSSRLLADAFGVQQPTGQFIRSIEQLLACVRQAAAIDSTGEELANAALAAYSGLQSVADPRDETVIQAIEDARERKRREQALLAELRSRRKRALDSALGSVAHASVDDVAAAVDTVQAHLRAHAQQAVASDAQEGSASEFGAEFDVVPALPPHLPNKCSGEGTTPDPSTTAPASQTTESSWRIHTGTGALQWMADQCREVAACTGQASDELALGITEALMSNKSDEAVGSDLFGLLGEKGIQVIEGLVHRRAAIADETSRRIEKLKDEMGESSAKKSRVPAVSSQVSVKSERQIRMEKASRKGERKAKKNAAQGANEQLEWLANSGLSFAAVLDHVDDEHDDSVIANNIGTGNANATTLALPSGASRHSYCSYEEINVPTSEADLPEVDLVSISELDEWAQPAFSGMNRLNRIQSHIFPTAFRCVTS